MSENIWLVVSRPGEAKKAQGNPPVLFWDFEDAGRHRVLLADPDCWTVEEWLLMAAWEGEPWMDQIWLIGRPGSAKKAHGEPPVFFWSHEDAEAERVCLADAGEWTVQEWCLMAAEGDGP